MMIIASSQLVNTYDDEYRCLPQRSQKCPSTLIYFVADSMNSVFLGLGYDPLFLNDGRGMHISVVTVVECHSEAGEIQCFCTPMNPSKDFLIYCKRT